MRVVAMISTGILIAACGASEPHWPERTLRVALQAPNPCWQVRITEIYRRDDVLLAVSRLTPPPPDRMCPQVIATVSHRVDLALPDAPVAHLVLGRDWDWGRAPPGYEFLPDRRTLEQRLQGAELLRAVGEGEGVQEQAPNGAAVE